MTDYCDECFMTAPEHDDTCVYGERDRLKKRVAELETMKGIYPGCRELIDRAEAAEQRAKQAEQDLGRVREEQRADLAALNEARAESAEHFKVREATHMELMALRRTAALDKIHREAAEGRVDKLERERDEARGEAVQLMERYTKAMARVAELEALAWPGEHRFPDLSWKALHEETVTALRAAEKRVAELEALQRRVAARLEGPWTIIPSNSNGIAENLIVGPDGRWQCLVMNRDLSGFAECEEVTCIIASLPKMRREVEELEKSLADARESLRDETREATEWAKRATAAEQALDIAQKDKREADLQFRLIAKSRDNLLERFDMVVSALDKLLSKLDEHSEATPISFFAKDRESANDTLWRYGKDR